MNRLLLILTATATFGSLFITLPAGAQAIPKAQILPPAQRAKRVRIIQGPEIESASDYLTIITWTSNNPGGSDEHFGVVHYGTDPKNLSETAKSHIRLNQGHPDTVFRVRLDSLKPKTTYYYKVDSEQADGTSDGVQSPVSRFTVPKAGERIAANPPQPVAQQK